jgi:hypothetical protein
LLLFYQEIGSSPTTIEVEVLIGVLTAVTLLLLFMFLVILLYSRRQKFLQHSPTSRGGALNPFPVQINMKELLTSSPILLSSTGGHQSPPMHLAEYDQQMAFIDPQNNQQQRSFEDCRSKWHSTGHVADLTASARGFRSSLNSTSNITANPLCSEYASVDIQNINHYRSLQQGGGGAGPPPPAPPQVLPPQVPMTNPTTYNLGHYFPRVSSEPPTRKSYQQQTSSNSTTTAARNGDLKVSFRYIGAQQQQQQQFVKRGLCTEVRVEEDYPFKVD